MLKISLLPVDFDKVAIRPPPGKRWFWYAHRRSHVKWPYGGSIGVVEIVGYHEDDFGILYGTNVKMEDGKPFMCADEFGPYSHYYLIEHTPGKHIEPNGILIKEW